MRLKVELDGGELLEVDEKRERLGEDVENEGESQGQGQRVKRRARKRATSQEKIALGPSSSPLISSRAILTPCDWGGGGTRVRGKVKDEEQAFCTPTGPSDRESSR